MPRFRHSLMSAASIRFSNDSAVSSYGRSSGTSRSGGYHLPSMSWPSTHRRSVCGFVRVYRAASLTGYRGVAEGLRLAAIMSSTLLPHPPVVVATAWPWPGHRFRRPLTPREAAPGAGLRDRAPPSIRLGAPLSVETAEACGPDSLRHPDVLACA